MELIRPL